MWVFESLIFLVLSSDNLSLDSQSEVNLISVRDESSILPESCLLVCSVLAPASLASEYPGIVLLGMLPPYD